jgi:hypothetical protein
MEYRYINFTLKGLLKSLFFFILMVIVFGGTSFMMFVTSLENLPSRGMLVIILLIGICALVPLGFATFNFLKKLLSMFRHAATLSPQGIKFAGEKEIPWATIETAEYHYDDGENVSDSLKLKYKTGGFKYFDISETDICNENNAYRAEVLRIILSRI